MVDPLVRQEGGAEGREGLEGVGMGPEEVPAARATLDVANPIEDSGHMTEGTLL